MNVDQRPIILSFVFLILFIVICFITSFSETEMSSLQHFLDKTLVDSFVGFRHPYVNVAASDITALGSITVASIIIGVVSGILYYLDKTKEIYFLVTALLGCGTIPWICKLLFGRARPAGEVHIVVVNDLSFPSGHSFVSAAVYIALALVYQRVAFSKGNLDRSSSKETQAQLRSYKYLLLGFLFACLIGVSRIYLGVHYTTDILGGLTLGTSWVLAVTWVYNKFVYEA